MPRSRSILPLPWLLLVSLLAGTLPRASGQSSGGISPAIVSGFDRFARHGELTAAQAGSLLISELNCAACHRTADPRLAAKGGPRLTSAGHRLRPAWLRDYLSQPAACKPGTTMPDLLSDLSAEARGDAIEALVAFLLSQQQPLATVKGSGTMPVVHEFWRHGDRGRGRELYHTVGCVACHDADEDFPTAQAKPSAIDELIEQLEPDELAELGLASAARRVASVPHADLAAKYTSQSLTMLLLDPAATRPASRMPSLRLFPSEAADIAAHLLGEAPAANLPPPPRAEAALADRGRSLFSSLSCVNCHEASEVEPPRSARPLSELNAAATASCLGRPRGGMPRYELDAEQVAAITARLSLGDVAEEPTAASNVQLRMLQLNCYACHERDGLGGVGRYRKAYFETVGNVDLGDEGRLPPPLTGIGRKLQPKALAAVFDPGVSPHRPHLTIRMPAYRADAVQSLLSDFPAADQVDPASARHVFGTTAALAEAGRELINTGCVECHPLRGESLPGVVGVDLESVTSRVRPAWFHRFVLDPGSVKERTRMPTFFPDGQSNRQDLLSGDATRQIAAIWAYLSDLHAQPLPEKIAAARAVDYELAPSERPIVLRTFMERAGTHAIAVGFPAGVHYAFDAEQVRLAIGWQGRFLDARGTWFERFAPPATPLGDKLIDFPIGRPLATIDRASTTAMPLDSSGYRFGGYRLDERGVPTLIYEFQDWRIEDRIEAVSRDRLRRTWSIRRVVRAADRSTGQLHWLAHAADQLTRRGERSWSDAAGLTVTLVTGTVEAGQLRRDEAGEQWLVPLGASDEQQLVAEYQW